MQHSDVEKMAALARLAMGDGEAAELARGLEAAVKLASTLQAVDTSSVEPMVQPLEIAQRLRMDEVTEDNRREEFQAIAPAVEAGLYLVPRVIE